MPQLLYTVGDLPLSGKIAASDVNEEFQVPLTTMRSLNSASSRELAGKTTPLSRIKYSDFYGKRDVLRFPVGTWAARSLLDTMYSYHYVWYNVTCGNNQFGQRIATISGAYLQDYRNIYSLTYNPAVITNENNSAGKKAETFQYTIVYRRGCSNGNDQRRSATVKMRAMSTAPYYESLLLSSYSISQWGC